MKGVLNEVIKDDLIGSEILDVKRDEKGRLMKMIILRKDGVKKRLVPTYSHLGYNYILENDNK